MKSKKFSSIEIIIKIAKKGEQFIYHKGHLAVDAHNNPEIEELGKHVRNTSYIWPIESREKMKFKNIIVLVQKVVKRYTDIKIKRVDCDYIAIKV